MKAILEFDMPDDQELYEVYHKAQDYQFVLGEILVMLRSLKKYGADPHNLLCTSRQGVSVGSKRVGLRSVEVIEEAIRRMMSDNNIDA